MDARLQRRVQRYGWDRASDSYERHWAEQLRSAQELLLEMAALAPGERVLDVACGTGLVIVDAPVESEVCSLFFQLGALGLLEARQLEGDDEAREAAHGEYLASIAPYHRADGYAVPGEFVVTRGSA
jgi:SAM-dependent methyltransferase